MDFDYELTRVLPPDLPNRETIIGRAARHLALIAETNEYMNLTRIVSARDAAIKHVLDSVLPWRMFERASTILDAGAGAGFPGIPLALVLPYVSFTLTESVQKKARFLESAVAALELPNVRVDPRRAEDVVRERPFDVVTARAFAPLDRALDLIAPALKRGSRALLYKGPDAEREIAGASRIAARLKVRVRIAMRFDLPEDCGSRCVVEVTSAPARDAAGSPRPAS